jgi:hypothetical protein
MKILTVKIKGVAPYSQSKHYAATPTKKVYDNG